MRRSAPASTQLAMECLESRNLLAVDVLEHLDLDPDVRFTPRDITGHFDSVFLRGDDGTIGPEAWVSKGKPGDLTLLKDIRIGPAGSGPRDFTAYQGRLYFAANNGFNGYELWVTQGSKASTQLVADIWPGAESGVPSEMVVFNDLLYFFANDGETGRELYRSDGTAVGTELVADLVPGRGGVAADQIMVAGSRLYFVGESSPGEAGVLWVSDGTAAGTQPLESPQVESQDVQLLAAFEDKLVFSAGSKLFLTDGSVEGTQQILAPAARYSHVASVGPRLFVASNAGLHLVESATPPREILESAEGAIASAGRLYAWNSNGFYSISSDLEPVKLLGFNSFFGTKMGSAFVVPNGLVFNINRTLDQYEIWSTNGTAEATQLIDTVRDASPEALAGFQQIGDSIYFSATNGTFRQSVWQVKAPEVPRAPLPRLEGDLSGDGVVDAIDVDLLFAALASDSTDLQFDLDGDGSVAASDRNYMVLSILDTRSGDVDINGRVDFADFLSLSANFGRQDVGWEDGDFDGDGRVAFSDFLLLSTHFGFDRDGPA